MCRIQMLNWNDKNLHKNLFEISEEDMAADAPPFNIIEEDKDDDMVYDGIMSWNAGADTAFERS